MTKTVLVVDDDTGIRELLKFRLPKSGFAVEASANGRECLDVLRTEPLPDVVLLDVRMPDMDGLDVLETIRAEFGTALPVVLLTGTEPRADTVATAATEYVTKPFTMDEVTACIRSVLGGE